MTSVCHVESLPVELWGEIFLHRLPLDAHPRPRSNDAPLILLQVCRSWRSIALATPRLWSSIRIFLENSLQWDPLPMLKLFLDCSKDTPLSITIDYPTLASASQSAYMAVMARIFSSIIPHSHRWRTLNISATPACIAALHEQGNAIPSLRSLKIDSRFFIREPTASETWPHLPFVSEMSRLKVLKLKPSADDVLSLENCRQLLTDAVELEECTLHARLELTRQSEQSPVITPVKKLRMVFHDGLSTETMAPTDCIPTFLATLECPNIQDLRVIRYGGGRAHGEPLTPFFSSAKVHSIFPGISPKLQSLRLTGLPLHNDDLLRIVDSLHHLERLDLLFDLKDTEADPVWDNFLVALTEGESLALPSLTSLRIECTGAHCSNLALQNLLHRRTRFLEQNKGPRAGIAPFTFKFLCTRPISPELYRAADGLSEHHITLTSLPL